MKNFALNTLIASLFLSTSFIAPLEAQAADAVIQVTPATIALAKKKHRIPAVGITADGKYNVWDLKGELNDINYSSLDDSLMWETSDIERMVPAINAADVGHGYVCDFVCKNNRGQIVGIAPHLKRK